MVRLLNKKELESLYSVRIRKDFPRNERRPLFMIRLLYARSNYKCFVLEENDEIVAYAAFLCHESLDSVLLDYFAVDKKQRGRGIGSRYLDMLKECWPDKNGMIIECEKPGTAKDQDENHMRERRIRFYTRAGAKVTPLDWKVFGVDYNILWFPILRHSCDQETISEHLHTFYIPSFLPNTLQRILKHSLKKKKRA